MTCVEFRSLLANYSFGWFSEENDRVRPLMHSHMNICPTCAEAYRQKQVDASLSRSGLTSESGLGQMHEVVRGQLKSLRADILEKMEKARQAGTMSDSEYNDLKKKMDQSGA